MAKIYLLSDEHIKSGTRPKTPKEKQRRWVKILSVILVIETVVLTWALTKIF